MFKNLGIRSRSGGGLLRNVIIMLTFMALASAATATCYVQVCVGCKVDRVTNGAMIDYYDYLVSPPEYCYSSACTQFTC